MCIWTVQNTIATVIHTLDSLFVFISQVCAWIVLLLLLTMFLILLCPHSTSTDRYANVDVGVLLYHIERFPGIIVLTTNLIDNLDKAFFRRLKFVLEFDIPPSKLRSKMWKVCEYSLLLSNSFSSVLTFTESIVSQMQLNLVPRADCCLSKANTIISFYSCLSPRRHPSLTTLTLSVWADLT